MKNFFKGLMIFSFLALIIAFFAIIWQINDVKALDVYENGYRAVPSAVKCYNDETDILARITRGEFAIPDPSVRYKIWIAEESHAVIVAQNGNIGLISPPQRRMVEICVITRTRF